MFLQRCRLLIKRIYYSFVMFKEENLAAAQIAQIFGSHLLKVQESAITDSGNKPAILNMDPRQFLIDSSPQATALTKAREKQIAEQLQREAEAACPLPQETIQPIQSLPVQQNALSAEVAKEYKDTVFIPKPTQSSVEIESKLIKNVERIAIALETIAGAIGKRPAAKKPKKKLIVK
jgi:hypothetical protein